MFFYGLLFQFHNSLLTFPSTLNLKYLSFKIRFLYVQIVVGRVKLYLNTVGNAPVKDVYVLRKISNLKFLLELARAVSLELLERVMPDQEGMWLNFDVTICNPHWEDSLVNH
jgi:hypothetical protein